MDYVTRDELKTERRVVALEESNKILKWAATIFVAVFIGFSVMMFDRVGSIQETLANLRTDVTEVKTDVAALQVGQNALKSDVATLQAGQNALKSDVAALQAGQNALKSDVAALQAGQNALKSDVVALQAGQAQIFEILQESQLMPNK